METTGGEADSGPYECLRGGGAFCASIRLESVTRVIRFQKYLGSPGNSEVSLGTVQRVATVARQCLQPLGYQRVIDKASSISNPELISYGSIRPLSP